MQGGELTTGSDGSPMHETWTETRVAALRLACLNTLFTTGDSDGEATGSDVGAGAGADVAGGTSDRGATRAIVGVGGAGEADVDASDSDSDDDLRRDFVPLLNVKDSFVRQVKGCVDSHARAA